MVQPAALLARSYAAGATATVAKGLPALPRLQDDVLLRALRFLDTVLQREASQKVGPAPRHRAGGM